MSQTYGKTRWKRFAVVMVPSLAATAAIGVSLAQGALAASFSVSGQEFTVTADYLDGSNFVQYGSMDINKDKTAAHPVAVSSFSDAKIMHLCQAVSIPTPFGPVALKLKAGKANDPAKADVVAKDLYIGLDSLDANAVFTNINIGVAAGSVDHGINQNDPALKNPEADFGNSFAQTADHATLTNVHQTAWSTSAGTFTLPGLNLSVQFGKNECPAVTQ